MLVTSETEMEEKEIYKVYHQLWRIEESFRILKSELDARPVYLQDGNRIKGHFLVCYAAGFSINGVFLKPLKIQVVECHKKNNLNSRMRRNEKWQNIMTENLKNR